MRVFGVVLLVVALGIGLYAMSMDTSVDVPGVGPVNNIGMMNDRQNAIIIAGFVSVAGVGLLIGACIRGSSGNSAVPTTSVAPQRPTGEFDASAFSCKCPVCAETIKLEALKCRYCGTEFDSKSVASAVEAQRAVFEQRKLRQDLCPKCGGDGIYRDYSARRFCPACKDYVDPSA